MPFDASRRGRSSLRLVLSVVIFATFASSTRLRVASRKDVSLTHSTADPSEISAILHATAEHVLEEPDSATTPFRCASQSKAVAILAEKPLVLQDVGKLAKGGNFLVSDDRRVLVKSVNSVEAAVLKKWQESDIMEEHYEDCRNFEKSLLLPIPLTFTMDKPYIVMFNRTAQLEDIAGSNWQVKAPYDIKPLPNLSPGLIQILKALMDGWGKDFPKLNEWEGYDKVSMRLARDLNALKESNVVDYSFFVHLILPRESAIEPPPGLSFNDGCIQEPTGKAIVCFNILDFLTEFTTKRQLESSFKGSKFDGYDVKASHAYECFGDLTADGCEAYKEYVSIKAAANKAEAKVAFMGTSTFRDNYECQIQEPFLTYEMREEEIAPTLEARNGYSGFEGDDSYSAGTYANSLAKYINAVVSMDEGAEIVREDYRNYMDLKYDDTISYRCKANESTVDASETLSKCKKGVYDFATLSKGLLGHQRIHEDLGNVIWNPRLKSIVVVRGAPQYALRRWMFTHSSIMAQMLKEKCVMETRFFHCKQIPGEVEDAMYDYKVNFKDLEILQVFPGRVNKDEFTPQTSVE